MNHFADRLRYARELRGLSQSALAKACGLSQGAIANYEAGSRRTAKNIFELAAALRVSAAWLASGTGEMETDKPPLAKQSTYRLSDWGQHGHAPWPFDKVRPEAFWSLPEAERKLIEDTVSSMVASLHQRTTGH